MTRINLIDPSKLSTKHLVAEYREITRLPGNLALSLNRKSKSFDLSEIPPSYVLGPGHVKFFYDKMLFLEKRFKSLVEEMIKRGYNPNFRDETIFKASELFYNDYIPTEEAINLNIQRILERTKQ